MFRKIISQLSLSPATAEEVARYAKTIQRKQRLYGMAALMLAFTSMLYIFVILFHPTYSTSQTANDLIPGGVPSSDSITSAYDANIGGFRDITNSLSITRQDLETVQANTTCDATTTEQSYITGKTPYETPSTEKTYLLPNEHPFYIRPLSQAPGFDLWCGTTSSGTPFAIVQADGNIISPSLPTIPPEQDELRRTISVSSAEASAGDEVIWTLEVTNPSDQIITRDIWFDIGDLSEYVENISATNDGIVSIQNHQVLWSSLEVRPQETVTLSVHASVDQLIDETAQQRHNLSAYDCSLTASFGSTAQTSLHCPVEKKIEQALYMLPSISNYLSLAIFITLWIISTVAYMSLRLHAKELRIIRKQINTGGLV